MPNYFVTGAAGFIAAEVCRLLLEQGHNVCGIDNLNDAYDVRLKEWRLNQLLQFSNFTFEPLDILNLSEVSSFLKKTDGGISAIFHLAARAGVRYSVINPWIYHETNYVGTQNILEVARILQIPKIVLSSTSSLYGAAGKPPFAETENTDYPLSPYAASKKAAEVLCYTYHHLYKIDVSVVRYFTVYGPAGRPDMSVFRFIKNIYEEKPIIIYGNGLQKRDFTYVTDIAEGTIAALKKCNYQIFNLGGDSPVSLLDLIKQIEDLSGKKAHIIHEDFHAADMEMTWANIQKAKHQLDWSPKISLAEGLNRTYGSYLKDLNFFELIQI